MSNTLLTNPLPEDFGEESINEEENSNVNSQDQLALDIETRSYKFKRFFVNKKMEIKRRSELLEVSMLWKSPSLPFAITSLVFNLFILVAGGIREFSLIPPQIPFFYNSIDKRWEQVDKSIVFIFPIILVIIESIIIQFSTMIFRHDRRLSITINWILTLLNFLIFIMVAQIHSLII